MPNDPDAIERFLDRLGGVIVRHRWGVVVTFVVLVGASLAVSLAWLEIHTDRNALVSTQKDYHQRYMSYLREFGDREYMYVVIKVQDLARAQRIADEVATAIASLTDHVEKVHHRIPIDSLSRHTLLFPSLDALNSIAMLVDENRDLVHGALTADGIPGIVATLTKILDSKAVREDADLSALGVRVVERFLSLLERTIAAQGGDVAADPLDAEIRGVLPQEFLTGDAEAGGPSLWSRLIEKGWTRQILGNGYFFTGNLLFVLVLPRKDFTTLEIVREPLGAIRGALEEVRQRYPDDTIGLTGRPVLDADEMQSTQHDMTRAAILAMIGAVILLVGFFRSTRRPVLTALVLAAAIAVTFGIVTLTVGHLNLLSMVFAVMLVSLGMEFGIHLIARYQEELAVDRNIERSIRTALVHAGKGNITGAATTAAAFYTALLVDFKGLGELGFIAGTGVLVCMLAMNTLLPALITVSDRWRFPRSNRGPLRMAGLAYFARRPRRVLAACAVIVVAAIPVLYGLRFDANLLELQAEGLPSVEFEKVIINDPNVSTWHAAIIVDSLDEVVRVTSQLASERYADVIGKWESVLDFVPSNQEAKRAVLARMLATLQMEIGADRDGLALPSWQELDGNTLIIALRGLFDRLEGFLSGTLRAGGDGAEVLEQLTDTLDRALEGIEQNPQLAVERLQGLQEGLHRLTVRVVEELNGMLLPPPLTLAAWPPMIRERVVSRGGKYVVSIYPRKDIWDGDNMAEFIGVVRGIDPEVTGETIQVYESSRIMRRGILLAALYSLFAVFVLIWLDFRRVRFAVLAMIPLLLGLIGLMEALPLLGLHINFANFFAIPILIGIGINDGVHMIHRFREDRSATVATRSTGTAVVLSSLTTMAGFGMLLLAHHRGVASLGALMVLGSFACLVASVVALPAILKLFEERFYHREEA